MTDLQKAIEWLQYVKQLKEANIRSYPHRTQDAEAIEHCKVLLDALRWVPVSERLPELGDHYIHMFLVATESKHVYLAEWNDGWYHHDFPGRIHNVTHWKYLPDAPKQKGWVVTQKTCGAFTGTDEVPKPEGSE